MKLASFEVQQQTGRERRLGVLCDDELIDINTVYKQKLTDEDEGNPSALADVLVPSNMREFLERGNGSMNAAREAVEYTDSLDSHQEDMTFRYQTDDVRLLSPLHNPRSIRDCSVFEEHLTTTRDIPLGSLPDTWYEYPVYYRSNHQAIVHPNETVTWPSFTEKLDYELELAIVVGKKGTNVSARDAEDYIAGFTIFNDFSARDIQMDLQELRMGPSLAKDMANGLGPVLVTPDDFDTYDSDMFADVNGERWSVGNSGDMYYSWRDIIEFISSDVTIYPGDVIGSGTVGTGCGLELDKWISRGDTLELHVEGIGTLRHTVGQS